MFERKINFVKMYVKQNGMSVKEYRTYMQDRIEDMKTRPKNKGLVLWYIWKENVKCRAVFSSLCKGSKKEVKFWQLQQGYCLPPITTSPN